VWHVPLKNREQRDKPYVLAADLDGTLLHPEAEEIKVRGRSGYRYLSRKSADLLSEISHYLPIVIATGRNAQSVERLVCQLPDVNFYGFVMENGFVARNSLLVQVSDLNQPAVSDLNQPAVSDLNQPAVSGLNQPAVSDLNQPAVSDLNQPSVSDLNQPAVSDLNQPAVSDLNQPAVSDLNQPAVSDLNQRQEIASEDKWSDVVSLLPEWERLTGYENCLGLIFPSYVENPQAILRNALIKQNKRGYLYQERHKIFVYPSVPSKLSGIRALGADPLIVLGDERNDLDMLRAGLYCGTLSTAHEAVKHLVQEKNGYCASAGSHEAAELLLIWIKERIFKCQL